MRSTSLRGAIIALTIVGSGAVFVPAAEAGAKRYANCAALNKDYRHGVGRPGGVDKVRGKTRPVTNFTRNAAVYNANTRRDGDHDGVACEKR